MPGGACQGKHRSEIVPDQLSRCGLMQMPQCMRPNIRLALDGPLGAPSQDQRLHDVVILAVKCTAFHEHGHKRA